MPVSTAAPFEELYDEKVVDHLFAGWKWRFSLTGQNNFKKPLKRLYKFVNTCKLQEIDKEVTPMLSVIAVLKPFPNSLYISYQFPLITVQVVELDTNLEAGYGGYGNKNAGDQSMNSQTFCAGNANGNAEIVHHMKQRNFSEKFYSGLGDDMPYSCLVEYPKHSALTYQNLDVKWKGHGTNCHYSEWFHSSLVLRHLLQTIALPDGSKSHNRNMYAILTNSVVSCSTLSDQRCSGYGAAPGIKSIWNSTWRTGGRPGRSSRKTSRNSLTTGYEVTSSGWPFVSAVPGLVTYLIASLTLDNARSHMLKSFDREDLETLWKLVKAKYGSTRAVEDLDLIIWGDLKTMFEPHVEDRVWKNQQDYKVLDRKI
ncbi:hypothetical protein Tco_1292632 [Tanacetum coccineum]